MAGYECYHCKQWVGKDEAHDCWTTTEAALTRDLSEDLQDAYARLRETVVDFGEQRIHASHHSIMFARKSCYFFVRPKKSFLEVVIFLGRPLKSPQVKRVEASSKTRLANFVRITHRDEVEAPFTDWLREAYDYNVAPKPTPKPKTAAKKKRASPKSRKSAAPKKKPPRRTKLTATSSTRRDRPSGRR